MVEEWYIPVKFFDEYIVQISFGVDYLNQNNQNISNKYDPIQLSSQNMVLDSH